jgi:hypothetical protein
MSATPQFLAQEGRGEDGTPGDVDWPTGQLQASSSGQLLPLVDRGISGGSLRRSETAKPNARCHFQKPRS